MRSTRVYRLWDSMVGRCHRPTTTNYPRYGGRGISVCDRWRTFAAFWEDMGPGYAPGLGIDRIDNTKGYEPGNCRWATPKQQARNRLCTLMVDSPWGRLPLVEAAEIAGIAYESLLKRHSRGRLHFGPLRGYPRQQQERA